MKVVAVGSLKDRVQLLAAVERCWEAGLAARAKGKIRVIENRSLCTENSGGRGGGRLKAHSEERDRSDETRAGCALPRPAEEEDDAARGGRAAGSALLPCCRPGERRAGGREERRTWAAGIREARVRIPAGSAPRVDGVSVGGAAPVAFCAPGVLIQTRPAAAARDLLAAPPRCEAASAPRLGKRREPERGPRVRPFVSGAGCARGFSSSNKSSRSSARRFPEACAVSAAPSAPLSLSESSSQLREFCRGAARSLHRAEGSVSAPAARFPCGCSRQMSSTNRGWLCRALPFPGSVALVAALELRVGASLVGSAAPRGG